VARKSAPKDLPREERPEFLAQLVALAETDPADFPFLARKAAEHYHDAVLAGHVAALDEAETAFEALVYVLNGNTFFGCKGDDDSAGHVLDRAVAAAPGQVPHWGQSGEFLLEVDGMRARVELSANMLGNHHPVTFHAVDLDKPFLSDTGYRWDTLTVTAHLGKTVEQAVRLKAQAIMASEGKPKAIRPEYGESLRGKKAPTWLSEALAGVRPDGQLAMFGDAPAAKVPRTPAQRQKDLRERRKARQMKPVILTEAEKALIMQLREPGATQPDSGVRVIHDDGLVQGSEFDAVRIEFESELRRLASIHQEPTYDEVVTQLLPLRDRSLLAWAQRNERLVAATPPEQAYPEDPQLRNLLGKALNDKSALNCRYQMLLSVTLELYELLDVTQAKPRLSSPAGFVRQYKRDSEEWQLGGSESAGGCAKERFKNVGRGIARPCTHGLPDEVRRQVQHVGAVEALKVLAAKVEGLEREQALLENERNTAFASHKILTERLHRAGLCTDYRAQPGE
jgi:hypothetical protein